MRFPLLSKPLIQRLSFALLIVSTTAHADLIPTGKDSLYYRLGGGQNTPVPAYNGAYSIPLRVEGDVGLGYNCGVFNPMLSITNSLNAIKNSFQNIERGVIQNATAAIAQFPMYAISRADPDLYNLLNNALLGARRDFELSMKSCQAMQRDIAHGKNPYTDWVTLSMGNDWKYKMSQASNLHGNLGDSANDDINQVSEDVEKDNGDNGIPWVHGANTGRKGAYAGGRGQPPIFVVRDVAIAGYNVILQAGRNYDDTSSPARTDANAHLVESWASPQLAANWITNVLGDEKITTFAGGDKQSTPGVGLLPANQPLTDQATQQLQALVSKQTPLTLKNLQALSAPGVMINTAVIQALQQKEGVTQAILITKLAHEIATAKLIDQSLLARQILLEGSQIPAVYANEAAQRSIKRALARLDQAINDLLFHVKVRKALVSNTVSQLLDTTHAEHVGSASVQVGQPTPPPLKQGAIFTQEAVKKS